MDPERITAVILTRDEERNLPRAITSLPHGMPVLVVDAQSADGTVAYAIGAGARVIERPWTDFVEARRFAVARVETPWLLQLDADEALDDVLRDALLSCDGTAAGYTVSRTTYFSGKPMRMWSDERLTRLVRTVDARIEEHPVTGGDAPLHERLACAGEVRELAGTLLHYSYDSRVAYREKFARYTSLEARGCESSLRLALLSTGLVLPRLAKNLLVRGAIFDGLRGWYIAWYSALYPATVAWKALRLSTA